MEQWEIRQPKLTHVLKNTDENLFQELAKDFSAIIGSPVKVSIVKEKERWMIFLQPFRRRLISLLYKPARPVDEGIPDKRFRA